MRGMARGLDVQMCSSHARARHHTHAHAATRCHSRSARTPLSSSMPPRCTQRSRSRSRLRCVRVRSLGRPPGAGRVADLGGCVAVCDKVPRSARSPTWWAGAGWAYVPSSRGPWATWGGGWPARWWNGMVGLAATYSRASSRSQGPEGPMYLPWPAHQSTAEHHSALDGCRP